MKRGIAAAGGHATTLPHTRKSWENLNTCHVTSLTRPKLARSLPTLTMKMLVFASICTFLFASIPLALGAQEDLDRLAVEGNGVIRLNAETFEILTSPKRTWSASVHFTALQPQRRCHPCKLVFQYFRQLISDNP